MRGDTRAAWFVVSALVTGLVASAVRVERVAGDAAHASLAFDVDVPHQALAEMSAADIEHTWRQRLREYGVRTAPTPASQPDAVGVRVTVVGADAADKDEVRSGLGAGARLELVWVLDGDRTMARWHQAIDTHELGDAVGDVESAPDIWAHQETGAEFFDSYLSAASTDELDRAIAVLAERYPLPAGHVVAYEKVTPYRDEPSRREPYYRTYMLGDETVLSNEHIADASVVYDPNTLMPEVSLTLTREGATRFGDATSQHLGRKIAILLDGRVESAPVIQAAIYGGRVSITMGGSDPARMEQEATALAGSLGSSSTLPGGIEARFVAAHERSTALVWALRALAAALGGVLALVIAAMSERRRWFTRAPSVATGPERWDRLALPALVTFMVPVLLWAVTSQVSLPYVNEVELLNIIPDPSMGARSAMGLLSLGLVPVTTAFVLVELYAILVEALVPGRRGRRLGRPADRRRLDRAAWILVGVLALVQAYFFATYLQGMSSRGAEVYVGGKGGEWVVVVTLGAGVMVQVIAAEIISRHGLCNGYLVLLASRAAVELFALLEPNVELRFLDADRPSALMFGTVAAVAAAAALVSTRMRSGSDGPRLPYTGVVPASLVRGGIGIVAFAAVWSPWLAEHLARARPWTPLLELGATVPLTALILWSTPRRWAVPGVVATLAFLSTLVLLPFAVVESWRLAAPFAEGVLLGVVVAELWVGALARVRLPDAVSVLVVHDVDRADGAADRLAAAGIPFALLGVRARAAMRFIGAFAPIAVRVPAARADEAAALLADGGGDAAATPAPSPPPS